MNEDTRTRNAFVSDIAEVSFSHLLELAIALGCKLEIKILHKIASD
jgi:hypothetical protein